MIREVDPPKPSMRLSTLQAAPTVAANRSTEPGKLGALVRGDLDWIVMRCLEKDRMHRYETATGLAADVMRFLADEPVSATPPTIGYRLHKFARRHRVGLVIASVMAGLVLLGLAGTTAGFIRVRRERDAALEAQRTAEAARRAEAEARDLAEQSRSFYEGMFSSIDPEKRGASRCSSVTSSIRQ